MKIKLFNAILMMILWTVTCMAQPNSPQNQPKQAASWGNPVREVELSVNLTNNVITVGSPTMLFAQIRNLSTNTITIIVSDLLVSDFTVYLTDNSKRVYKIVKPSDDIFAVSPPINIGPGESHSWAIPMTVGKNVKPGYYTLNATRHFKIKESDFELISNSLDVQIK